MNNFIGAALSLTEEKSLQEFYASPIDVDDFKKYEPTNNDMAYKIANFIIKYNSDYGKLPKFDLVCATFKFKVPKDAIGEFSLYEPFLIRRKKIHEYGSIFSNISNIYNTINLDSDDADSGFESIEELVDRVTKINLGMSGSKDLKKISEIVPSVKKDYNDAKMGIGGHLMPWPSFNDITGGLKTGEALYIAARPGFGKTFYLLRILLHLFYGLDRVLVVSTEMTEKGLLNRLASIKSGISSTKVRKGILSYELEKRYFEVLDSMAKNENIRILGSEFENSTSRIESAIIQFKPKYLLIDGIYLVIHSPTPKLSKIERMPHVTALVKTWGKRYDIVPIVTTQLNRTIVQSDTATFSMDNLSYADSIGQDADFILALRATEDMKEDGVTEARWLKTREGDGGKPFKLSFEFTTMNFNEVRDGKTVTVSNRISNTSNDETSMDDIDDEVPF